MSIQISHISDNHGYLIPFDKNSELVVCSGDLLPNFRPQLKNKERQLQKEWIHYNAKSIQNWIGDKKFLFCAGNHDFIDAAEEFRNLGIDAISLTNSFYDFKGLKFYGFPYVPYIGFWNWELTEPEMKAQVRSLNKIADNHKIDVLVAHCPLYGVLDNAYGSFIGNAALGTAIAYSFDHIPKAYLNGHCHEEGGKILELNIKDKKMIVSNAATTHNIINI